MAPALYFLGYLAVLAGLLWLLKLRMDRWPADGDCPDCSGRGCELCEGSGWVPWCHRDCDEEDYGKCHFGTSSLGRDCPDCFRKRKS